MKYLFYQKLVFIFSFSCRYLLCIRCFILIVLISFSCLFRHFGFFLSCSA